jgi:hypothetical protein
MILDGEILHRGGKGDEDAINGEPEDSKTDDMFLGWTSVRMQVP